MFAPHASRAEKYKGRPRSNLKDFLLENKKRIFTGLGIVGILTGVCVFFISLQNPDIFWHLSAGKYIIQNRAIPTSDFLSWSKFGAPWTDFEWLLQGVYYLLYSKFGYAGLMTLKILTHCCSLFVFLLTLRLYKAEKFAFIAVPLWAISLLPNLDIRPENFTLLFFSIEFYFLERLRLRKLDWGYVKISVFSFLFFALWANLHAGFMFGFMLLGFLFIGNLIAYFTDKSPDERIHDLEISKTLFTIGFFGLVGTFFNPNGWKIYSVLLAHFKDMQVIGKYIVEWQASEVTEVVQLPFWIVLASAYVVVFFEIFKDKKLDYPHVFPLLYFSYQASRHSRHTMFVVLISLPYVFKYLSKTGYKKEFVRGFSALLISFVLFFYVKSIPLAMKLKPWKYSKGAIKASEFLKENENVFSDLKMYNPWGQGGYFGYALYPDSKVFLDGRYIFHEYLPIIETAKSNNLNWTDFLLKYGFDYVLLERQDFMREIRVTSVKTKKEVVLFRPFYVYFMPKKIWALVFWDDKELLYVKRSSFPKSWIAKREFGDFRPADLQTVKFKIDEGYISKKQVLSEFEKYRALIKKYSLGSEPELEFWQKRIAI
jgi:hypothetical protein